MSQYRGQSFVWLRPPRRKLMAKKVTTIRSLARAHTETALRVLTGVMNSKNATPAARIAAANSLLDRGWGKVNSVAAERNDETLKQQLTEIVRTIVDPEDQDGPDVPPAD